LTICASATAKGIEERSPNAVLASITGARKGILFDAWLDVRFARTLLEALDREDLTATRRGAIRAVKTAAYGGIRGEPDESVPVSHLSAEQSNTSIVYGERMIMKLFRRVQPGVNPDFEIGRQLTEKAGFTRAPAVAAAFEYARAGDEPSTIAMLQQFVESQADGWTHALDEVDRFYDEVEGETAPDAPPSDYTGLMAAAVPKIITNAMGSYLATADTLGRRTAEMHTALASDSSNPAFAPEPLTPEDLALVGADAADQARKALQALEASGLHLPPEVGESAARLLESRDALFGVIRSAPAIEFSASKIRVHGDYHLGQVLWAEGDFYLFDFEGEPDRPIAQRRLKQSPLRDVAGMIRSFSYAAYAGLFAHTASRRSEFERLEPWARIWQLWTTAAFLRGYFTSAGDALFVPPSPQHRDALLRLFVLDKALYELNYELNNRPDWVRIPLRGIFELLRSQA
jgi:maltose alpha-D-glucosyltransferase/alpha-amylase